LNYLIGQFEKIIFHNLLICTHVKSILKFGEILVKIILCCSPSAYLIVVLMETSFGSMEFATSFGSMEFQAKQKSEACMKVAKVMQSKLEVG